MYSFRKIKRNDTRTLERNSRSYVNNINNWIQQSECKIIRYTTEKTENCCKKKKKTGTSLRMSLKLFSEKHLPHELSLTTRQKTNLRNALNNKCQLL